MKWCVILAIWGENGETNFIYTLVLNNGRSGKRGYKVVIM